MVFGLGGGSSNAGAAQATAQLEAAEAEVCYKFQDCLPKRAGCICSYSFFTICLHPKTLFF